MAATIEAAVIAANCTFVSIQCPEGACDQWRANVRNGPGWIIGDYAATLEAAVIDACDKLRTEWEGKRSSVVAPPAPAAVDDLSELLG